MNIPVEREDMAGDEILISKCCVDDDGGSRQMNMSSESSIRGKSKELLMRLLSSLMFIPFVFFLCSVSNTVFCVLCVVVYAMIVFEIYSIRGNFRGKWPECFAALSISLVGIASFMYCRAFYGIAGSVFLICMASFCDIGAYLFGKILGGPRLCPRISPNKTWAGMFGGIITANVAFLCLEGLFLRLSLGEPFFPLIFSWSGFWTVQCIIIASVAGDLLESLFKRRIKVKDMGKLLPGHGGVMDRLDSLIFASIVFLFLVLVF
ncbi:MAG: phosphatidate cytidylyltransferase [Holosporaceae bacterium]|jgi:phosphatidate cytidylyltransferase|nr:phosphatidate cytidylyltransferase [Holosporaceae bacterium]